MIWLGSRDTLTGNLSCYKELGSPSLPTLKVPSAQLHAHLSVDNHDPEIDESSAYDRILVSATM